MSLLFSCLPHLAGIDSLGKWEAAQAPEIAAGLPLISALTILDLMGPFLNKNLSLLSYL